MRSRHDGAHAGFAFRDSRKGNAGSEHSFFEQFAGEIHGQAAVSHDDWRDRSFAGGSGLASDVEAEESEFFFPETSVVPELFHPLWLGFEHVEGGDAGGGDRRRMRGRKQKRPRAMIEIIDQVARTADVSTESAD